MRLGQFFKIGAVEGVQLRGCSCLNCTNRAECAVNSIGALLALASNLLVHLRQVHPLVQTFAQRKEIL